MFAMTNQQLVGGYVWYRFFLLVGNIFNSRDGVSVALFYYKWADYWPYLEFI